jgi:hypothetical protein
MTNPTRQTKLADLITLTESRSRFDGLSQPAQMLEKLRLLQAFVRQMSTTDSGRRELQERQRVLGPCDPDAGGEASERYAKLRCWLDKDLTSHTATACALSTRQRIT